MTKVEGNTPIKPPETLQEWASYLTAKPLPLIDSTLVAVNQLSDRSGKSVDSICEKLLLDPGAVAILLKEVNSKNKTRLSTEVTTLENAVMMVGILYARQLLKRLPVLKLPVKVPALINYVQTVVRAYHAGYQACEWAQVRGDMVVKESYVAAFMFHIAEMMMWLHSSAEMKTIMSLRVQKQISSREAQMQVLGFTLEQLAAEINQQLHMPEIVTDCFKAEYQENYRVKSIRLSARLARVAEFGWYTKAMRQCITDFAELFQMDYAHSVRKVHKVAILAARDSHHFGVATAASLLPQTTLETAVQAPIAMEMPKRMDNSDSSATQAQSNAANNHEELSVSRQSLNEVLERLKNPSSQTKTAKIILQDLIYCLHQGVKLERVIYSDLDLSLKQLKPLYFSNDVSRRQLEKMWVDISKDSLFKRMMIKTQSLWLNQQNANKFWHKVPVVVKGITKVKSFYIMSLSIPGHVQGMLYADAGIGNDDELTENSYIHFKKLCKLAIKSLSEK